MTTIYRCVLAYNHPIRPAQPPTLSGMGNNVCHAHSAVMLCGWEVKAAMAHFTN